MEPVAAKVVSAAGEVVAELVVDPRKLVLSIKTQIEGIEGTAVSNQALTLNGCPLADDTSLASCLAALPPAATSAIELVLLRRPPLLSGHLSAADLEGLLAPLGAERPGGGGGGSAALERAIDAYSEDLRYSASEAHAILAAVAAALLPEGPEGFAATLEGLLREAPFDQLSTSAGRGLTAQRATFVRVVRQALTAVQKRLSGPDQGGREEAALGTAAAADAGACVGSGGRGGGEGGGGGGGRGGGGVCCGEDGRASVGAAAVGGNVPGGLPEDVIPDGSAQPPPPSPRQQQQQEQLQTSSRDPRSCESEPSSEARRTPWIGAGQELQQLLHRRWAALERAVPEGGAAAPAPTNVGAAAAAAETDSIGSGCG
mmetsp:Transcript_144396/g.462652  ORF Transcript_144396/g.462652 Transcript_144396/m.462652 type:complete len:372 (-) Transcript_144396:10-1125(-)